MPQARALREPGRQFFKGVYQALEKKHANPPVNLAPFGRWTLRDKAAQRRLPSRSASQYDCRFATPSRA